MSILSCEGVINKPEVFLAMTSLTKEEFEDLCNVFENAWDEYVNNTSQEKDTNDGSRGGRKATLTKIEDKLFFILFYLKTYPLQEIIAHLFGMSQSQANYWIHLLSEILKITLDRKGCLPKSLPGKLLNALEKEASQDLLIDGAERRRQRPKDNEKQKELYSGKKKAHTVKNIIVAGYNDDEIKYLSNTCEGKKHDKKIVDEAELEFPEKTDLYQDTGFQGFCPEGVNIHQPKKKPKGGELTQEEKEENAIISSIRVSVEHVIAGVKRCRIVKDVFRNTKDKYDNLVMQIACGLHNFRSEHRLVSY
jgi:hypothetical protein